MKKICILFAVLLFAGYSEAQDIIQWRGENRDGIYNEAGLLKEWPTGGPEMLWHYDDLGNGHTSAAVTNEFIYITGEKDNAGYLYALDHKGNLIWKVKYGGEWTLSWPGVRTTPLIYKGRIYLMSGLGKIICMDQADGNEIWSVDLIADLGGRNIQWGMTENLLIDDDILYCTPGGLDANMVALNSKTGKIVWKSKGAGEKSAYCSPAIIKLPERKILVTHTERSIIGLDAADGTLLWKHPQTNRYSVHANTPLYKDGSVYCVSGYGAGGVMLRLSDAGSKITEEWRDTIIDSRMGGVVLYNDQIFGSGDASRVWGCIDWETGKKIYSSTDISLGNIILADNMLYCYGQGGEVALVNPARNSYKPVSKFIVPYGENQHWAHLVIHNKRLYVRHGNSLMVYDISK